MDQALWIKWAHSLQQRNLTGLALTILEGTGPIKLMFSQVLLGFAPFVGKNQINSWETFARMLEDQTESQSFAGFLRGEKSA
jgi:hypothetical protein